MSRLQPLQRAAAQQMAALPQGEKADVGRLQTVRGQNMARRWWRPGAHFGEVLGNQCAHVLAIQLSFMNRPAGHDLPIFVAM